MQIFRTRRLAGGRGGYNPGAADNVTGPMARANPYAIALRKLDFFAGMPDEHLALVARVARRRRFRAGQVVIEETALRTPSSSSAAAACGSPNLWRPARSCPGCVGKGVFRRDGPAGRGPALGHGPGRGAHQPAGISRNDFKVLLDQAPLLAYAMMRVLSTACAAQGP